MDEIITYFSEAVKALGDGRVGGYIVRFSTPDDPDLEGDFFTKSTDFGEAAGAPVYYQHGQDSALKTRRIGRAEHKFDDFGIWAEAQLNLRDEYEKFIYQLAQEGKLGWSSGTAAHLVEKEQVGKANWIKSWMLGIDDSLTPTPAEPRNTAMPLKSLSVIELPQAQAEGDEPHATESVKSTLEIVTTGVTKMDENTPNVDGMAALNRRLDDLQATMAEAMKFLDNMPGKLNTGYVSQDGGKADPGVKSFGDFALAIMRKDHTRLTSVYKSAKTLGEDSGAGGGYLVPEEYVPQLLQIGAMASPIVAGVTTIPVRVDAGTYPALDQYLTPTAGAGDTAFAAGAKVAPVAEAGTLPNNEPSFEEIRWRVNVIGDLVYASLQLMNDSPQSIEALLRSLFGVAVASKKEFYILRGNGAGMPLGILNAPCAVGVSPATNSLFSYPDALSMISHYKSAGGAGRWIMHNSVYPDVGQWEIGTAGAGAPQIRDLGYGDPIFSEHLPQADSAGNTILADLRAYLLFERQALTIDYSEHYAFNTLRGTWRFYERLDGQPWMKSYITLADPTGSFYVSPFVYHND